MGISVVIGSEKDSVRHKLKSYLSENRFDVVATASDGYELLRHVNSYHPSLCVCDFTLKGLNGYEVARVLVSDRKTGVLALVSTSDQQYFSDLKMDPYFAMLKKPINGTLLLTQLQMHYKSIVTIKKMEKEIKHLKKEIKETRLINQAKYLLMENKGITEDAAHKEILKKSMDEGYSKVETARYFIEVLDDEY